jgi:hypothetical protein
MMLEPVSTDSLFEEAMEARAPPSAWKIRATTSQGMNYNEVCIKNMFQQAR